MDRKADAGDGLWVGLDVGTQGTKGVVLDMAGKVRARASVAYGLVEGLPEGAAEQHPETWIGAVAATCSQLLSTPGVPAKDVRGVGVSGQQHGLVVLDDQGEVVRPAKLWCDTSTAAEARELSERWGRPVPTGYTASKVLWIQRHEPHNWARARTILLPHDYVNLRLTGKATMEAGDASGTGFFDPRRREFDAAAVEDLGPEVMEMLPGIVPAGSSAGRVSGPGAALTGIPEGTLVATGGGDNMMSAIGSGATRQGVVVMSLGTSGTVFCRSEVPIVDEAGLIAPFCDSTGAWLPLLCVMNLTGVLMELVEAFAPGDDHGIEHLTAKAADVPKGVDGLIFVPYLVGERVPDLPLSSGALVGLRSHHLRPGPLFRAALEGTAMNLAWGVERMRELGIDVSSVRLVGGGARNPLWRQIIADALDASVTCLVEPESAALGGAIQARWTWCRAQGEDVSIDAVATPLVQESGDRADPRPEGVAVYREMMPRFQELVGRLFG
jgi:D-xylulose kinase